MSFSVSYVTPGQKLGVQSRASFTGAHTLAKMMRRKGCVSITVEDKQTGNEVYYLR